MKRSRMQTLGTWATELEVIAAASLLNTTFYTYAKCGETFKWLKQKNMRSVNVYFWHAGLHILYETTQSDAS